MLVDLKHEDFGFPQEKAPVVQDNFQMGPTKFEFAEAPGVDKLS
jgi:hypothetical protein